MFALSVSNSLIIQDVNSPTRPPFSAQVDEFRGPIKHELESCEKQQTSESQIALITPTNGQPNKEQPH